MSENVDAPKSLTVIDEVETVDSRLWDEDGPWAGRMIFIGASTSVGNFMTITRRNNKEEIDGRNQ